MSNYTIYALAESNVTISNGVVLDGVTQGDGSHLQDETITLNNNNWETIDIADASTDANFGDNDGNQTLDGDQTVFGTFYSGGTRIEAEYTLYVRDSLGNEYTLVAVNVNNSSPAFGTVEGLAFIGAFPPIGETLTVYDTSEGPPNTGGSSTPANTYATPPCFVAGTMIDTFSGPKPIEALRPGNLILTLDNGYQPLRLTLSTALSHDHLARHPGHRPIRIARNAFGPGIPNRAITVSPQHRILQRDWRAPLYFGADEVLVAAKHLTTGTKIRRVDDGKRVDYFHLVFDTHQVVSAHGLLSESFLPGDQTLLGVAARSRELLFAAFPRLTAGLRSYGPSARPALSRREAVLFRGIASLPMQ